MLLLIRHVFAIAALPFVVTVVVPLWLARRNEALILGSRAHFWWAMIFLAINAVYIPLVEEPMLAARFAASYDEYRRNVPRLLPRLRPWR